MNPEQAAEHFSPAAAVDRGQPTQSLLPATPVGLTQVTPLPRADASEPAELTPVAVRGYN